MLKYNIGLALRALRRNAVVTALMVIAVSVGIGASMTVLTALRAMSADPIPAKSDRLFSVRIDNWGPDVPNNALLSDLLSYPDAMALMRAHKGLRQSVMYAPVFSVTPQTANAIPFTATARAAYSDFFAMFDVPFAAGGPWTQADDDARAKVVVLGARMAQRLFPAGDALGRSVMLGDGSYRIVGVLAQWKFQPRVYDLSSRLYQQTEDVFLPLTTAADRKLLSMGGSYCSTAAAHDFASMSRSECRWVEFWVELSSAAQKPAYLEFLNDYSAQQRRIGRFHWPANVALLDVNQTLRAEHIVPGEMKIATLAAFGFLLVCLVNATGLMLARLSSRATEFSVRRALGASKAQIFVQCLAEATVVGMSGGLLGLGLTVLGLAFERAILREDYSRLISLNLDTVVTTLGLALLAVLIAALYPAWRTSRLAPAWNLKAE
ncbi:MAG TPA: ABC transporter permease [Steroidobacteraceae bacterium]|nr:ABC transporter permease [Steroidobacteraceae bacterium]